MSAVVVEYPEAWLPVMGTDAEHFAQDIRMASAVKMFEMGKLTSGQAAKLAGIPRVEFMLTCHRWGAATVNWSDEEIRREFEADFPGRT
jgi:predicted HTH domain antitoxin